MIRQEEWMDIKFMRRQGLNISQISRKTGHTRRTVRRHLESGDIPRYRDREPRRTVLDPFKDVLLSLFWSGVGNGVVLYEKLLDLGYHGSYDTVKKFLTPLREETKRREASVRFETDPGKQSQVDWGHFNVSFEKTGQSQWMYLFLLILGWSRFRAGCFLRCQDIEHFLLGHQRAFEQIGGITDTILYDNLKSVVLLRRLRLSDSRLNTRFLDFAAHYGFVPRLCAPGRPQTKGKVENQIGFVRNNFFCGRRFWDSEDLNRQFSGWLGRVNSKPHGTTREVPTQRLQAERDFLICLDPARRYPLHYSQDRRVPKDCLVSWQGRRYSVPAHLVGKGVEVTEPVEGDVIQIFHLGEMVASHRILPDRGKWSIDPAHFRGLVSKIHSLHKQSALEPMTAAGPGGSHPIPQVAVRNLSVYEQLVE